MHFFRHPPCAFGQNLTISPPQTLIPRHIIIIFMLKTPYLMRIFTKILQLFSLNLHPGISKDAKCGKKRPAFPGHRPDVTPTARPQRVKRRPAKAYCSPLTDKHNTDKKERTFSVPSLTFRQHRPVCSFGAYYTKSSIWRRDSFIPIFS